MRPALKEGYEAVMKVFQDNEFIPSVKIKRFPNGTIRVVEFGGLTRQIGQLAEEAVWGVMIRRDEENLDKQFDILGFGDSFPMQGSVSNNGWLSID